MKRLFTALLVAAALPATAAAHIQMLPAVAAPGDSTLFTLLVPNESDNPTVQIDLKIPDGVIPFSFEEVPGWERTEKLRADGALDIVTWKGSLPAGEFARFSFLAGTPETPGEIAWPAVQRYEDGSVVRWIGAPDSEEPAAITTISADAPSQNAGGESGSATAESDATGAAPSQTTAADESVSSDDDSTSVLSIVAIVLSAAGLLAAAAALVAVRRRRG
jgi:MYXO-CTERM domain-containing protein